MTDKPTIFQPPTEQEVADLLDGCCVEPLHSIARRLAFERDRLKSAIEGPMGWKENHAMMGVAVATLSQAIEDCYEESCRLAGSEMPAISMNSLMHQNVVRMRNKTSNEI